MKSDGLKCNFQRLNNQYPFGYVYDENGHIGFVGAKINDPDGTDNNTLSCALENSCISDYFRYIDNKIDYNA